MTARTRLNRADRRRRLLLLKRLAEQDGGARLMQQAGSLAQAPERADGQPARSVGLV